MTTRGPFNLSATPVPVIRVRLIAYQLESRASVVEAWGVEALDAVSGLSAYEVARGLCRDFASEHRGRWVRVSTWDLSVFLRGLLLPERPSTRLAWLQSLDDEHVRPHCQVVRPPDR
ncbi:hypothetical protein ACGFIV_32650 [Sphaerisporangium sp. NPDC049003]|uniref:hypothetical protein n=1 Tax=Sphaerisporangium sp. NPDC049003 TaxID=3364517 RepID=UPI0037194F7B